MRAELGDTVEELVHRVDVPTRIRERSTQAGERMRMQMARAREVAAERRARVNERMQPQVARAREVAAEQRARLNERVQPQVAHAREVAAERVPAVQNTMRERPGVVGGTAIAAVLGWLLMRAMRRRRTRREEDMDGTR
jgi:F0F1-type ATP synthase assembly protein I